MQRPRNAARFLHARHALAGLLRGTATRNARFIRGQQLSRSKSSCVLSDRQSDRDAAPEECRAFPACTSRAGRAPTRYSDSERKVHSRTATVAFEEQLRVE